MARVNERENSKVIDNNQKIMREMEERYKLMTQNYREQVRRNSELSYTTK